MNASRPILLLPFVYGATLGVLFKIFGYSFEAVRHFSLALVLLGFVFLALLVWRLRSPLVSLGLVGAFMIGGYTVAMGNVGRMEAYLFATICGVLLLWQRGRRWPAVAVLSATPMIHPNGMYFLLPMAIYAVVSCRVYRERPSRAAIAVFVVSGLVWGANGLYALNYWDGFMHDTAYRLGETTADHRGLSQFGGASAVQLGAILVTAAIAAWRRVPVVPFLYWPFRPGCRVTCESSSVRTDSRLFFSASGLVHRRARRRNSRGEIRKPAVLRPVIAGVTGVGLIVVQLAIGRIDGPKNYVEDLSVAGMRITGDVAYFDQGDRRAIAGIIQSLSPQCQVSVEVYPWGDGLLIADLEEPRVRFQVPYFDPVYQPANRWLWGYGPTEAPLPDLYLVHLSRYHPRWLDNRQDKVLAHVLKMAGVDPVLRWLSLETAPRCVRYPRHGRIQGAARAGTSTRVLMHASS